MFGHKNRGIQHPKTTVVLCWYSVFSVPVISFGRDVAYRKNASPVVWIVELPATYVLVVFFVGENG